MKTVTPNLVRVSWSILSYSTNPQIRSAFTPESMTCLSVTSLLYRRHVTHYHTPSVRLSPVPASPFISLCILRRVVTKKCNDVLVVLTASIISWRWQSEKATLKCHDTAQHPGRRASSYSWLWYYEISLNSGILLEILHLQTHEHDHSVFFALFCYFIIASVYKYSRMYSYLLILHTVSLLLRI